MKLLEADDFTYTHYIPLSRLIELAATEFNVAEYDLSMSLMDANRWSFGDTDVVLVNSDEALGVLGESLIELEADENEVQEWLDAVLGADVGFAYVDIAH